ncbi:hypothetical protein BLNAU_11744 [Blattamonas nauphoetae]|uniref:Uncharacterized protein n=1 Tax=Blattamonas nauphoetae TaxID=2049346 RepID=A0ABQ9XMK4_9EUKA|nr:hypothetical protein BLNAU_11744 [Blattamonas nauphoetae]
MSARDSSSDAIHALPLASASPSPHSFQRTSMTVVRSTRNTHIDCLPPSLSLSRRRVLHSSLLPSFTHNAITQQSPPS